MRAWSVVSIVLVAGCATSRGPVKPLEPPPLPPIVEMVAPHEPESLSIPDVMSDDSMAVIHQANGRAVIRPTAKDFIQAEVVFPFKRGALYRLDTAVQQPVDIMLQPGERLLKYVSGEKRWIKDISEEIDPVHILLTPTRPKLRTRITLVTTMATYYLQMHSHVNTGLAAVSWRHPPKPTRHESLTGTFSIGYGLSGASGKSWEPLYAWDDGRQSYLLFPEQMAVTQAPVIAVVRGDERLRVNYRPLAGGRVYRIDRILDAGESFELGVHHEEKSSVILARTSDARQIRCPGADECRVVQRWMRSRDATE